ncbi:MAG TPA: C13 family peptidase, partial [Hyphomonadaceae bacterium]|nr:C13 family peptidase [Hyphomonadaceae bacterium]
LAQGDPLGGQFGAVEAAMTPPEAAKQVEMMASALSNIPAQRPGVVDTYVLVASLWNDPVFENEAKEAAAILARRYDAQERTIILSAGRGAGLPRAYPAATPDNFQAALGKIGATIDPNEDLVVVFVTSHGAPDGAVALQEKGRMGGALRALPLRDAFAQAGIRNKVVIVSACFSGYFILPFSDDNTVVLTAAAADKTSFGCEPQRDWTFFGDALFNHALRGGQNLVDGFDEALVTISKWEDDMHAKWQALPTGQRSQQPEPQPSNPQKNVGEAAMAVVNKAESFGNAINCAGLLSFALDRVKTGRPLKGLADVAAVTQAQAAAQAKANTEGAARKRSPQDIAKSIATVSANTVQVFSTQVPEVSAHAARCAAPATPPAPSGG